MSLLPPASTPLERAIADTAAVLINGISTAPAEGIIHQRGGLSPWLASQWGLGEFAQYFPNNHALIDAGLPWLKLRGTAAAVKLALSWVGLTATLEEDGHRLQLDPGSAEAPAKLDDLLRLVRASIPAHVLFYRLYHGYDLRPVRLDQSRLDDAMLDDDSGVWVAGVKLSFGTRYGYAVAAETDQATSVGALRQYSTRVWGDESWRLDSWNLDSEVLLDSVSKQTAIKSVTLLPDAEPPLPVAGFICASITLDDIPPESIASNKLDQATTVIDDPVRGWAGSWSGNWRDPVLTHTTFESL